MTNREKKRIITEVKRMILSFVFLIAVMAMNSKGNKSLTIALILLGVLTMVIFAKYEAIKSLILLNIVRLKTSRNPDIRLWIYEDEFYTMNARTGEIKRFSKPKHRL